jgi:major intracellular serine protease
VLSLSEAKLVPFTVNSVCENCAEIPLGVRQIEAPKMWKKGEKGLGVVVAILDTGVDREHPDLKDNIIDGRNFTNEGDSSSYQDYNGHGTHVAGTIGARENEKGVVGVAPCCKLLICKVLDRNGSGSYDQIIAGLKWATEWTGKKGEKVRVINMSLGGAENDPNLREAILNACSNGILVVVASGNEGDNREETMELGYPALYNECITVSAHDKKYKLATFSNNNLEVDVISAGVEVHSTYLNGGYAILSGTSMATPHIAGAIALILNEGEKKFKRPLSESEIYAQMVRCCITLGHATTSEGHGRVKLSYMYRKYRFYS